MAAKKKSKKKQASKKADPDIEVLERTEEETNRSEGKKELTGLQDKVTGLIPCRLIGNGRVAQYIIDGTHAWTGPSGKEYKKNSDGVFLLDSRDAVAAARHGFVRA